MKNFKLPELPYADNALEPVISSRTIAFHYSKHHQTYVNNLNNLIEGTEFENKSLEEIVLESDGGVFNNAAQVWNHTFYWESLKAPQNDNKPTGAIAKAIEENFGSFDQFKEAFSKAAATLFGSGWAWLTVKDNKLEIIQESNAGNPLKKGLTPLLTIDVWEHAYYLDYQNRRPDHINDFWSIVNWEKVEQRFLKA